MSSRGWVCSCLLLVIADTQVMLRLTTDGVDGNDLTLTSDNPENDQEFEELKKFYVGEVNTTLNVTFLEQKREQTRVSSVWREDNNGELHKLEMPGNWSHNISKFNSSFSKITLRMLHLAPEFLNKKYYLAVSSLESFTVREFTLIAKGNPRNINGPGRLQEVYKATLNESFDVAFKVEGYPTPRVTRVTFKHDNSQRLDVSNWSQGCLQDSARFWVTTLILVIPNITMEMLDTDFFVDVSNSHGSTQFYFTLSSQDLVHGGGGTAIIISTIVCVIIISVTSVAVFLIVKKNKITYDRPAKIRRRAQKVYKILRKRTTPNTDFWDGDPDTYHEIVDNLDETFRRLDADITMQESFYLELMEPAGSDDNSAGKKDHQDAEKGMDYLHPISGSPHFLRKNSNTSEYTTPVGTTSSAPQNLDTLPRATSMSESCTQNAGADTYDLKPAFDKSALMTTAYNKVEDVLHRDLDVSRKSDFEREETPLREIDLMKECEHVDAQLRKIRRVFTEIVKAELVDIHGTQEDTSVFSEIVQAEQVDIHGTQEDTSVITEIVRAELVDLHGTQEDTSVITEIVKAEQVDIHGTQEDTSVITEIVKAGQVDIHGTQEDTSVITEIVKAEQVDIHGTQEDTSVISEIARVEQVDIHGTQEDTSVISEIARAEQVDMRNAQEGTCMDNETQMRDFRFACDKLAFKMAAYHQAHRDLVLSRGSEREKSRLSEADMVKEYEHIDAHLKKIHRVISDIIRMEQVRKSHVQEGTS